MSFKSNRYQHLVLAVLACISLGAHAQGIIRVGPSTQAAQPPQAQAVKPLEAPLITESAPATPRAPAMVAIPGQPMPTPLPAGAMPAPIDLKQEAIDKIAPLNEKEIKELRTELDRRATAMTQPMVPQAKPVQRSVRLDLSPGTTPEIVRVALNQGTLVNFLDAAGRPWPVVSADSYNPRGLDIATIGVNSVSIGVKSEASRASNIAVLLEGNIKVVFTVVTGQREVDYSVDMQLAKYVPGLPPPVGALQQVQALGSSELMDYLLGTPPKSARQLQTTSAQLTAWQISPQRMIVRTDAMVAAPTWTRRQSSSSGVTVYDLPVSASVSIAYQGAMSLVNVSGFSATKEQNQ